MDKSEARLIMSEIINLARFVSLGVLRQRYKPASEICQLVTTRSVQKISLAVPLI